MNQILQADAQRKQVELARATSLCEVFQSTAKRVPNRVALRTLDDNVSITWGEYADRVRRIAGGLATLAVEQGSTVALMLENRPEFHLLDTAVLHLGATTLSVYNTLPAEDVAWILADAGVRVIATERKLLPTVLAAREAGRNIETVILVDGPVDEASRVISLADVESYEPHGFDFEAGWRAVAGESIATLIYTSGTTGPPKGVELSHRAILGTVEAIDRRYGTHDGARVVSMLPMAHMGERQFSHYWGMAFGFTNTPCPDIRDVPRYYAAVQPHYIVTPPRLFEKFRAAIEAKITAEPDPARKTALEKGLDAARRQVLAETSGGAPEDVAARAEEFHAGLGRELLVDLGLGNVELAITGSSPVREDLLQFWHALGLPIVNSWGMTELGGIVAFSKPGDELGTCGQPMQGLELRLLEDGEILARSPFMMSGYRNQPEKTREAIDEEGWLHTGDIGVLDAAGNLRIVDRKKELIINASGKNMSPANIEAKIKDAHPMIGNACVIGDDRPYNVALITLDPEAAPAIAREIGLEGKSTASLAADPMILRIVSEAIAHANERMSRVEQIKRFRLLGVDWAAAGDELTPTMKLKRRQIAMKYAAEIQALYDGPPSPEVHHRRP